MKRVHISVKIIEIDYVPWQIVCREIIVGHRSFCVHEISENCSYDSCTKSD